MADPNLFPHDLTTAAAALLDTLRQKKLRLVTAESCTGGLIAGVLTEIAGSSDVLDRGYVTYSNEAKADCIGVPTALIESHGAVSRGVAEAMAAGALKASRADVAIAVTGIAGPGGGTETKPVGLVYVAVARRHGAVVVREYRFGDIGRTGVRLATVMEAMALASRGLADEPPA